jgi:hypothetical protein
MSEVNEGNLINNLSKVKDIDLGFFSKTEVPILVENKYITREIQKQKQVNRENTN